jgi:anti-sigma regulatory factor (Ser/Thr protein kinase)
MKRESWLPAAPASAPEARAIVRAAASELRLDEPTTCDLLLATTEAVANAVEHGKPCDPRGIYLGLEAHDGTIGIEVRDCGCFPPEQRTRKPDEQGGRGMPIIATIMDKLEVAPSRETTRVRFEKRLATV